MASNPEMPCYLSHKTVRAVKIYRVQSVVGKPNSRELLPENGQYPIIEVDHDFVARHKPFAGGYYIVYKDGYQSFSPAQAFEDGYTLCDPPLGSNPSSAETNQTQVDNTLRDDPNSCEGSERGEIITYSNTPDPSSNNKPTTGTSRPWGSNPDSHKNDE